MTRNAPPARRALVVDDGPLNRKLMSGLLTQMGCEVDTAASGEEALAKCAARSYDVAFVDLHMPGIDGHEMVNALREAEYACRGARTPVVVLTADDTPPPGDQGWFDLFVSKPITSALLRASFEVLAASAAEQAERLAAGTAPVDPVDEFLKMTSDALERMTLSLVDGDFDSILAEAHAVKSTGSSLGFGIMNVLGTRLEQDAKARSRAGVERTLFELERSLACT